MILLSEIIERAPHGSVFLDVPGRFVRPMYRLLPSADKTITYCVGAGSFPSDSLFFLYGSSDVSLVAPGGYLLLDAPSESLPNVEKAGAFWVYRKPKYHLGLETPYSSLPGSCDELLVSGLGVGRAFVDDLKWAAYLSGLGWEIYAVDGVGGGRYFDLVEEWRRAGVRGLHRVGTVFGVDSFDLYVGGWSEGVFDLLRPGGVMVVRTPPVDFFRWFPGAERRGDCWVVRKADFRTGCCRIA